MYNAEELVLIERYLDVPKNQEIFTKQINNFYALTINWYTSSQNFRDTIQQKKYFEVIWYLEVIGFSLFSVKNSKLSSVAVLPRNRWPVGGRLRLFNTMSMVILCALPLNEILPVRLLRPVVLNK